MLKIINSDFNPKEFNEKAIHPMQSWEWGEAKRQTGVETIRLLNGFQMTLHKIPHTNYKIGYIPHSSFPSNEVLDFLQDYGKKNNIIFIKFEPYINKNNFQFSIFNFQKNHKFQIQKSPHPLFPSWTIVLDLTKSETELLKNMKPKTRYNIRLAEKKEVVVREESTDEGFETFIKLYLKTCKRQKYFGHNYYYHKIIWDHLKKNIAHILIAYYKDIPLVAYELFLFKDQLYYTYGGSSDEYRNFMPANLLMWESIKFGKKMKAKKFDMWGSLPPGYDKNNPWAGFTHFKEGYGGKFVELAGSFDLVISPILYKLYNLVYKIRSIYLNFIS